MESSTKKEISLKIVLALLTFLLDIPAPRTQSLSTKATAQDWTNGDLLLIWDRSYFPPTPLHDSDDSLDKDRGAVDCEFGNCQSEGAEPQHLSWILYEEEAGSGDWYE